MSNKVQWAKSVAAILGQRSARKLHRTAANIQQLKPTSPKINKITDGTNRKFHGDPFQMSGSKKSLMYNPVDEFTDKDYLKDAGLTDKKEEVQNVEEVMFQMFKDDSGKLHVAKFLQAIFETGLKKNDPRLAEMFNRIKELYKKSDRNAGAPENLRLDLETFTKLVENSVVLLSRAFRHQFRIPDFKSFTNHISEFYWNCKDITEGKVASYIPQLARMDDSYWGVSICTIDGQRFSIGDTSVQFTIQSTSKPLAYAIALDEVGQEVVHRYVGQEPSGRNFNELVLDFEGKPHNPLINAGAIMVTAILQEVVKPDMSSAEKFDYVITRMKAMAGGEPIGFNNAVFLSERETGDRNFALGYYMKEQKAFPEGTDLKKCLDFYFQLCSMEATCETVSLIAGTLANGGICPITGEKVLTSQSVRDTLSLMHSCGMYDYSGQFAFRVGLPAKSGVSGAMMIVVPNVAGICLFSPPLDKLGNTVRGVAFCEQMVDTFNFHRYDSLLHMNNKKDPRRHKYETKGLDIVSLLFAAASGDVSALRRYYMQGKDFKLADYDGRTVLHVSAAEGHAESVSFLLNTCDVELNVKDRWDRTPLDDAKIFKHDKVVEVIEKYIQKKQEEEAKNTKELAQERISETIKVK